MKQKVIFLILLSILVLPSLSFAANEQEEITLTTYYPAPYGNYTEIEAESITLSPQSGDPTTWAAGTEGEFRYSNYNDAFFYYYVDGTNSGWRHMKEGSGGTAGTLECIPGTEVTSAANQWSAYSTCPAGYLAIGLYRVDIEGHDHEAYVNDFKCGANGCNVWVQHDNCGGNPCPHIDFWVWAQCCRIQ